MHETGVSLRPRLEITKRTSYLLQFKSVRASVYESNCCNKFWQWKKLLQVREKENETRITNWTYKHFFFFSVWTRTPMVVRIVSASRRPWRCHWPFRQWPHQQPAVGLPPIINCVGLPPIINWRNRPCSHYCCLKARKDENEKEQPQGEQSHLHDNSSLQVVPLAFDCCWETVGKATIEKVVQLFVCLIMVMSQGDGV